MKYFNILNDFISLILIILFLFLPLLLGCNNKYADKIHQNANKYTIIDVDHISNYKKIPVEIIIDNNINNEKYLKHVPSRKEEFIGEIRAIVQGPDSTFLCSDVKKNIISQFSKDGIFKKVVCPTGSGPGECLRPSILINFKNQIYFNDYQNNKLEILDINGGFIRDIFSFKHINDFGLLICDNNNIIKCNHNYNESPIIIMDSLGVIINNIGQKINFGNNYRQIYSLHLEMIIAEKDNEDCFWFCYKTMPFIFKYDLNGNCIEEIKIIGNLQNERYDENQREMFIKSKSYSFSFNYIIQDLKFINESLFISLTNYGILELKINNKEISNITKIIFEHESQDYLNSLLIYCNIAFINNNFYFYSFHTISRILF